MEGNVEGFTGVSIITFHRGGDVVEGGEQAQAGLVVDDD